MVLGENRGKKEGCHHPERPANGHCDPLGRLPAPLRPLSLPHQQPSPLPGTPPLKQFTLIPTQEVYRLIYDCMRYMN